MPKVPLNIKSMRRQFYTYRTEADATKAYNHILETMGRDFTEREKGTLCALYERRLYDIKNPTMSLRGRNRSKKTGRFINSGEDE